MASPAVSGLSVVQPNSMTEARLRNAVVATDVNPNTANPTIRDIQLAIHEWFGSEAIPVAITRFRSDFVIQFATLGERDIVASSEVLEGLDFDMLLVTWSNRYGGKVVEWQTEVSIDIEGFPPHTFDPSALASLLGRHCSIQAYTFSEARGACRVDAYALNARSIPKAGEIGVQYPVTHGVCNVMFPVTMMAYNYHEAPEFHQDDILAHPVGSVPPSCTDKAVDSDIEMLEKTYERLHLAYDEDLAAAACHGHGSGSSSSSYGVSSGEPLYPLEDCSSAQSFESDRSWKL